VIVAAGLLLPAPARAVTPFVNEIAGASANDDGFFTSLALDIRDNPHVSHQDRTTLDLIYARKSSSGWIIEVADASANDVGRNTSIALDAQGNVHICYQDETASDPKYARRAGGAWTIDVIDGSANFSGYYTSLAVDAQGNPHVCYYDVTTTDLVYARKLGGVWTFQTVDAAAGTVGFWPSLALDAQDNPHVSYQDGVTGNLKFALKSGGTWKREVADASANDVGAYSSLALDAQGTPHVTYLDATTFNLKFAKKSGGVWTTEIADASGTFQEERTSLALDVQGNAHVAYPASTLGDLKYARRSATAWTVEIADVSANAVGRYPSLALDTQGNPRISYWDGTIGDLKYADAAVHVLTPSGGVTWPVGSLQQIVWTGIGPIDILISSDGGTSYQRLESGITTSPYPLRVTHLPTRFARVRIERTTPFSTAATDSFFKIDATISLAKFETMSEGTGTRLFWETRPGPEAEIRYRVERATDGVSFAPIADGLASGEYLDPSPAAAARYRLIAINGLGDQYVLGETSAAPRLAAERDIVSYPNPASGPVEILYRVTNERPVALAIYDASGRLIRSLASGRQAVGVQSATWDRRDSSGQEIAPGTYFLRLTGANGYRVTEKVTIAR
jgi:hypothetical protein